MFRRLFLALLLLASPALAVQTSHWTHTSEADFKKGSMHNVVATNLGDVKLSRAVKTILEEDAKVSAVYAMVEAPDGTIYAGTGPHGVVLSMKDNKVSTVAAFEENTSVFALLVDAKGNLTIGVSGEKGKVFRLENPSGKKTKPVEIFSEEGVQYVWGLAQTPDGNLYVATGPGGTLFEIKPDKSKSVLMSSDENNLLSLLSDGKDILYVGTDPNGLVYRVNRKTRDVFVLFDAPESEISCLALDKKGNLYAGTAESAEQPMPATHAPPTDKAGRPEGTGGVPLPSTPPELPKPPGKPEPNPGEPDPIPKVRGDSNAQKILFLNSLDSRGRKPRTAGAQENPGLPPTAKILMTPFAEILLLADGGAGEPPALPGPMPGKKPEKPEKPEGGPTSAPSGLTPGAAEPDASGTPKPQGNAVYKIDPDGFVTEIFRQPALVLSLLEKDGTLLVGTGSEGLIYQINPAAEETVVLAKVEPKQVLCLLAAKDGRVLLGMANVGGIAAMSSGVAAEGTFVSPVMDATQISRFGKIHLQGSLPPATNLTLATRSGNVQDTGKAGWSKWSDEMPAVEYIQVPSPSARFMQYRLTLTSKDGKSSPLVDEVDVAYQIPNVAPVIKSVKVGNNSAKTTTPPTDAASALAAALGGTASPAAPPPTADSNRTQTIAWEAEDGNGDAMQFSVYCRNGPKSPWILLKDKLTESKFDWDTRTVADGRYEIKVVASDALANPPGEGKTGSRVSDAVVIDNTPPVIGDVKSVVKGSEVKIDAKAVDRTTIVAAIEYSVDSHSDWQMVLPSNKMFDSPEETVSFTVRGLSAGAHQITLRATDAKGNQAFESVLITIEPATAGSLQ